MSLDPEEQCLIKAIFLGESMDSVVDFKVPYDRILRHIRSLLEHHMIEFSLQGNLVLTERGQTAMEGRATVPMSSRGKSDPLAKARIVPLDVSMIAVPEDDAR